MSGGFGGGGFGSMPFGATELDLDAAATLRIVQLTANMLAITVDGDADAKLIAKNWGLLPLDPDAHARIVQSAQAVTSLNADGFELPQLVLATLPATLLAIDGVLTYGKRYRVSFANITGDFTAMLVAASAAPADVRIQDGFIYDIANPYLPRDALVFPPQLGTYQVTSAGDFATDRSGEAGLRKRIVRRVLAAAGSYFHLQGYGVGIEFKGLLTVDQLRRLSARIRAQVLQEPEAQKCASSLVQSPADPSVVSCTIEVTTNAGLVQAVVPIQLP